MANCERNRKSKKTLEKVGKEVQKMKYVVDFYEGAEYDTFL